MDPKKLEYRIVLKLTEEEFLALARYAYKELRSPRNQARLLLRKLLIELGYLQPVTRDVAEVTE